MFLKVDEDGYRLGVQHDTTIDADDLPVVRDAYKDKTEHLKQWNKRDEDTEWTKSGGFLNEKRL